MGAGLAAMCPRVQRPAKKLVAWHFADRPVVDEPDHQKIRRKGEKKSLEKTPWLAHVRVLRSTLKFEVRIFVLSFSLFEFKVLPGVVMQ